MRRWERRSTFRPAYLTVFNDEPTDDYYLTLEPPKDDLTATCEFDFLGYSEAKGRITLTQEIKDGLIDMQGEFTGMTPGLHALRVQEWGDMEHGCASTGEIYNPFGSPHGHSHFDIDNRRVGDIEHIQARFDQGAEYKNRDSLLTMWGPNSILGRSMVIYEREDDFDQTEFPATADRAGRYREGKGKPVACCVVGLAHKAEKKIDAAPIVPKPAPPRPTFVSHVGGQGYH